MDKWDSHTMKYTYPLFNDFNSFLKTLLLITLITNSSVWRGFPHITKQFSAPAGRFTIQLNSDTTNLETTSYPTG